MVRASRVYVVGAVDGSPEERARRFSPACEALAELGFQVTAPALSHPDAASRAERRKAVRDEMLAFQETDYIVALDGAERCWEIAFAAVYGMPVLDLDELLQELAA